ncbi:type II secretion system F family protein [Erythrobacter sp. MTPC3]|uniref:type II secretion system F family protein n=1 Tax=Erythrobacter sp. MTPC3 TaxID=3056564 RepID=UPI0036F26634
MSPDIIRILILLTVFAALFLILSLGLDELAKRRSRSKAVNQRMDLIGRGVEREKVVGELIKQRPTDMTGVPDFLRSPLLSLQRLIFASGIQATFRTVIIGIAIAIVAAFFLVLIAMLVGGIAITFGAIQLAMIFAIAIGGVLPVLIIQRMAQTRRKKMEQQFPIALGIFVRALKTGHPVASAIDLLTTEMEDPIGSEFGLVSDEVAYGADLIDSLQSMAERWDIDDMRMFVVSLSLQGQTGGNLAEILENISKVIRDRANMFMKVRALSSEGRMTGWMPTVLPIFAFVMIFVTSPSYYIDVMDDNIFRVGSIGLLCVYALGVYIIRRMIDLKV